MAERPHPGMNARPEISACVLRGIEVIGPGGGLEQTTEGRQIPSRRPAADELNVHGVECKDQESIPKRWKQR
jgi:hypothetical protein